MSRVSEWLNTRIMPTTRANTSVRPYTLNVTRYTFVPLRLRHLPYRGGVYSSKQLLPCRGAPRRGEGYVSRVS